MFGAWYLQNTLLGHFLTATVVAFAMLFNRRNGALSPAGKTELHL